jgi:hypothetical protein
MKMRVYQVSTTGHVRHDKDGSHYKESPVYQEHFRTKADALQDAEWSRHVETRVSFFEVELRENETRDDIIKGYDKAAFWLRRASGWLVLPQTLVKHDKPDKYSSWKSVLEIKEDEDD